MVEQTMEGGSEFNKEIVLGKEFKEQEVQVLHYGDCYSNWHAYKQWGK